MNDQPRPVAPPPPAPAPTAYAAGTPYPPPWPGAPAPAPMPGAAPAVDGQTRSIAIGLFLAAALVLIGVVTPSWFTERGAGAGLTGLSGGGRSISWGEVPGVPKDIIAFAYLGLLSGIAAIVVTGVMGGMLLAGKARTIPLRAFNIVLGLAAFTMTMFAVRLYTEDPKHMSFGFSGFCAIGGLLVIGALVKSGVTPRAR
jgi:hypothetical protein